MTQQVTMDSPAAAGPSGPSIPPEITTPPSVKTRLGTLAFTDGAPSMDTVAKVYDNLDFLHAVDVFLNAFQGASMYAAREGFRSIGVEDNAILIFSELMDAQSLFLTANADTVYFLAFVDLSHRPMVVEMPPQTLGTVDDLWFRWWIDFGFPGPDRGEGGRFLLLLPGYTGTRPDSGFHVAQARTSRVLLLGRSFLTDNDPKPTVQVIRRTLKIYPYASGAYGTSIATLLDGKVGASSAVRSPRPATRFVEGSGKAFNTIPTNDTRFHAQLNALVQAEGEDALDLEIMGHLAAIGIVKGKPFRPDARMQRILAEAAAVGNATGRALNFRASEKDGFASYPRVGVDEHAVGGWLQLRDSAPARHRRWHQAVAQHRRPNSALADSVLLRLHWYAYTGITPAMIMRLTNVGSQYLMAFTDANQRHLDGSQTYRITLPHHAAASRCRGIFLLTTPHS